MKTDQKRSVACRVWKNAGKLKLIEEMLQDISAKCVEPDDLTLDSCASDLHDIIEELDTIGYELYPSNNEIKKEKKNGTKISD